MTDNRFDDLNCNSSTQSGISSELNSNLSYLSNPYNNQHRQHNKRHAIVRRRSLHVHMKKVLNGSRHATAKALLIEKDYRQTNGLTVVKKVGG